MKFDIMLIISLTLEMILPRKSVNAIKIYRVELSINNRLTLNINTSPQVSNHKIYIKNKIIKLLCKRQ